MRLISREMTSTLWTGVLLSTALCSHAAAAAVGMVEQPCPTPLAAPAVFREQLAALLIEPHAVAPAQFAAFANNPQVKEFNEANQRRAAQDWPALCRYRESNAAVLASHVAPRVVLMGDSITEFWEVADPALFDGKLINRGISGQTTAQMLLRFRAVRVALIALVACAGIGGGRRLRAGHRRGQQHGQRQRHVESGAAPSLPCHSS